MDSTLDAVVEIFAWAGFGLGAFIAGVALVLFLLDGTWVPVQAVVEEGEHGLLARWFGEDGAVNEAPLSAHDHAELGGRDMVEVYARRGWMNRMRTTPGSPAVRAAKLLSLGLIGVGVVALITSWILLFVRG